VCIILAPLLITAAYSMLIYRIAGMKSEAAKIADELLRPRANVPALVDRLRHLGE